jgi:hypothetical protein
MVGNQKETNKPLSNSMVGNQKETNKPLSNSMVGNQKETNKPLSNSMVGNQKETNKPLSNSMVGNQKETNKSPSNSMVGNRKESWRSQIEYPKSDIQMEIQIPDFHHCTKSPYNMPGKYNQGSAVNDNNKIKQHKYLPVIKTLVQNLDLEHVHPRRAGIIIYTVVNGSTYFGFGLDAKTHDLTDFGGGVRYKTDINVLRGAIREFEEETLGIFDPFKIEDIKQCPVIYDENNLIIFIHLNIDPDTICKTFNEKYKQVVNKPRIIDENHKYIKDPEVCGITWLTWEEFRFCIVTKGIMFYRVQNFLSRAGDFSYLL